MTRAGLAPPTDRPGGRLTAGAMALSDPLLGRTDPAAYPPTVPPLTLGARPRGAGLLLAQTPELGIHTPSSPRFVLTLQQVLTTQV